MYEDDLEVEYETEVTMPNDEMDRIFEGQDYEDYEFTY